MSKQRLALILLCLIPVLAHGGVFDVTELMVDASPGQACSITLSGIAKVMDHHVSPAGPDVAVLVKNKDGSSGLIFWRIGTRETSTAWKAPVGFEPRAVTWHPRADCLFVSGSEGKLYRIMRLEKQAGDWVARGIFESPQELRRLVSGPSPFIVQREGMTSKVRVAYRLFFGMKNSDGTYRTVSVTEQGKRFYQVIGPARTFTQFKNVGEDPSRLKASFALPVAFHPAGHELIWQDGANRFHCAIYRGKHWHVSKALLGGAVTEGTVAPTPNGLGMVHWRASSPGVGLLLLATGKEKPQATDFTFVSTPSSVPDGGGIVGITRSDGLYTLHYAPIDVPLADVVNAWMFQAGDRDIGLLEKNRGLFRALDVEQLYHLYESENYYCGRYDNEVPTRPYFVTTDIFWELFAAAYEGLFILKERDQAVPAFWAFVAAAHRYYGQNAAPSRWRPVFNALNDLREPSAANPETDRIRAANGRCFSDTLGTDVDYGDLKPRGHYSTSPAMQDYFRAFRYLTSVFSLRPDLSGGGSKAIMDELKQLPPEVKHLALVWIGSYRGFISPSRTPLVWKDGASVSVPYALHPSGIPALFPLAWGFDNEVLLSTVYHEDWPQDEQVRGPAGHRLIPSGLDVAAAMGSAYAGSLLESSYAKYPPLQKVIEKLARLYETKGKVPQENENLYDRWMTALAVQWAEGVRSPDSGRDERIWKAKRLQTALASWATLRHATVLVNERTGAECGEGGFEPIVLRAPRGYVEPDPRTFAAIAELFDLAVKFLGNGSLNRREPMDEFRNGTQSLRQGIIRRLSETAKKARMFQSMAEKQLRGEALSPEEYEEILCVGRVAEHHLLVFKSMSNKDHGLSTPEPIPKIVDVSGGGRYGIPLLMAAVGKPAEWDHVVPYFGRRQLVKGSVYSYYEFVSDRALNDTEWRNMVSSQARPSWIEPFFSDKNLPCPAPTGY